MPVFCYHLLISVARSLIIELHILSAFYNQKKFNTECKFFILLHKTMKKLNSKLENNTRQLF